MQDINAPDSLRDFQISYGRHVRSPGLSSLPKGVPPRRSEIYESLLFNNISGFIDNCFPVSRSLFDDEKWQKIRRAFFQEWRCSTPIFSQIPYEFVRFISERPIGETLPPWLPELLHYEWVELEVDLDEAKFDENSLSGFELKLNPTAKLLAYQWPVQAISSDVQPEELKQTCLVVYRDIDLRVRFNEVNATTLMLLQTIDEWPEAITKLSELQELIKYFAEQLGHPDPDSLMNFALQLLSDLKDKHILTGDLI